LTGSPLSSTATPFVNSVFHRVPAAFPNRREAEIARESSCEYFPGKVIQKASGVNGRSFAGRSQITDASLRAALGSQLCYDAELHVVSFG
jgi:hypothetical protein